MYTRTRGGPSNAAPSSGSRTLTITQDPTREVQSDGEGQGGSSEETNVVGTLRLRGVHPARRQRIVWDESVVDNEGCGKKKSKICCIYHKPRAFDESSSEESSSDSDSDASSCDGRHPRRHQGHQRNTPRRDVPEPNAYEKQPRPSDKGKGRA